MSESKRRLVRYRGIWCITWTERGRTHRRSLGTADRATAETAYEGVLSAARTQPRPSRVTVADCVAGYLEATPRIGGRKSLSHFGAMLPQHIDRSSCETYTKQRTASGIRPKTIHTELGLL